MVLQAHTKHFPLITTVFDSAPNNPHSLSYSGSVRATLMRLLPADFFFTDFSEKEILEDFHKMLPMFRWSEWGDGPYNVSIFLLSSHRVNAAKFFYEMISRWLLPGRRLNISSFFTTDFKLPEITSELFTVCEIVISLDAFQEIERIRQHLPIIETEIRLGLVSVYHASRILEIKGLSADEKTALIQERIASLLEKRPADFDYDIFSQMQHFLVMCGDEFKAIREYGHMSRIVYVFYLFRKAVRMQVEGAFFQRHLNLKFSKTQLHLPFGVKRVVGVFVGINFLNDNEIFDQRHVLKALRHYFPLVREIEDSCFVSFVKEDKIQLIYLEIEKGDGEDFSLEEIRLLKERLPDDLKNGVEKLMRPLFMPRNEEEVMRNIVTLSHQLKYPKDLPQVIISFDEQTDADLSFTIICLRIVQGGFISMQEMFQKAQASLKLILDRIKIVGTLRKKYLKEASVFRVKIAAAAFLRQDHSVDLLKARQAVMIELQRILGEVRDYNGGMIAKQYEQFNYLKNLFINLNRKEEILLENFFHSIFPIELRSLIAPDVLKNLFSILLGAVKERSEMQGEPCFRVQENTEGIYVLLRHQNLIFNEKIVETIRSQQLPSSQLASLSLQAFNELYLGFILLGDDMEVRAQFLKTVKNCIDSY